MTESSFAESLPLSSLLAAALRAQTISSIARQHIAHDHGGTLPAVEGTVIAAFVDGLLADRLDLYGPLDCEAIPHLTTFLIDVDAETLEIFYDDAHRRGDPAARKTWKAVPIDQRKALIEEAQKLSAHAKRLWEASTVHQRKRSAPAPPERAPSGGLGAMLDDGEIGHLQQYLRQLMDAVREQRLAPDRACDELLGLFCTLDDEDYAALRGRVAGPAQALEALGASPRAH